MTITENQKKALIFLQHTGFDKPMAAREFALKMWPKSNMHTTSKNQGNGATRGKAAWLCGGSYLAKLQKKGLVSNRSYSKTHYGYFITAEGLNIVANATTNFREVG